MDAIPYTDLIVFSQTVSVKEARGDIIKICWIIFQYYIYIELENLINLRRLAQCESRLHIPLII